MKDNVRPGEGPGKTRHRWQADRSIDTQNSLDPITIDPKLYFDIEKTADPTAAKSLRASCERAAAPDLMIGNPPYGVRVVKGAHYDTVYSLSSPDSYGYFIANAIKRLPEGKRLIYIISSSFLTIGTHKQLATSSIRPARSCGLSSCIVPRSGIDIFPAIVELERCSDASRRADNIYQFYDLWRLHPTTHSAELKAAYAAILGDLKAGKAWPFEAHVAQRYTVRQGHLDIYTSRPIFEGMASLYEFMADSPLMGLTTSLARSDGSKLDVRFLSVRGRKVVKLKEIAQVKLGLQSGDNGRFYRVAAGVKGGAKKGGYKEVPKKQIVTDKALAALTPAAKADGIVVNDPTNDRFFVPLDKAGESDIEGGLLAAFWRPVEFYVDWSRNAVAAMKAHKAAVFRNPQYYLHHGISYSDTGIYSPIYRLGHSGVFDQKGSNIFCEVLDRRVLLGMLCSTLLRYFAKAFINHSVVAQPSDLPLFCRRRQKPMLSRLLLTRSSRSRRTTCHSIIARSWQSLTR